VEDLHVEYAERGYEYGILFMFNLFLNTCILNTYVSIAYTGGTKQNALFVFVWCGYEYGILFMFNLFLNICILNTYVSIAYTGETKQNALFIFVWLRHRNM